MKDKREIIEYVINKLKQDLKVTKKTFEQSNKDASELPGPMQSRYDTMGIETAWLADGMAGRISELEKDIYTMEHLKIPKTRDKILICSVVGLRDTSTEERQDYFILPSGGGEEIPYNGSALTIISNKSPLSQSLFGHKQGDKVQVELPGKNIEYLVESLSYYENH